MVNKTHKLLNRYNITLWLPWWTKHISCLIAIILLPGYHGEQSTLAVNRYNITPWLNGEQNTLAVESL